MADFVRASLLSLVVILPWTLFWCTFSIRSVFHGPEMFFVWAECIFTSSSPPRAVFQGPSWGVPLNLTHAHGSSRFAANRSVRLQICWAAAGKHRFCFSSSLTAKWASALAVHNKPSISEEYNCHCISLSFETWSKRLQPESPLQSIRH